MSTSCAATSAAATTIVFKLDLDKVRELHAKYNFEAPLLDAGGLESPTIADYDVSVRKAIEVTVTDDAGTRRIRSPHPVQTDRYLTVKRPWSFIDPGYTIINPEDGSSPWIEDLPKTYRESFSTVILVSVLEHTVDPYLISDALFAIVRPAGHLFNSTPFLFPYHPAPEDNWRFSPVALRRIHERSGFEVLEADWHVTYSTLDGIGDTNPQNYGAPQAIQACYALCRKPL